MRVAAVNVALWSGGRFSAAAVADPFNGEIFWTDGRAAFVRADGQDTLWPLLGIRSSWT